LKEVSQQFLSEADVICFDELQVTDIADAMVLKTLFEYLFEGNNIYPYYTNQENFITVLNQYV